MARITEFLFTWNEHPSPVFAHTQIEDDTLRDGLQGGLVRFPSTEEKIEILRLSAAVGTRYAMLGFPASSEQAFEDSARLLEVISAEKLGLQARFLARARPEDAEPIVRLRDRFSVDVRADFFVGVSPLRREIEGWSLDDVLEKIEKTSSYLRGAGCPFNVSIEDSSRTPPEALGRVVDTALKCGASSLIVCDTVGDCVPSGAANLVKFIASRIDALSSNAKIEWHGHNDRGLALANALSAVEAGAYLVSGAFLGIGERTGNTSLEQVIMFLHQAGNTQFRVDLLTKLCAKVSEHVRQPIHENAPLLGAQAFATATGTHSAALLKARALGIDFEDYVFSAVPASHLGRRQEVLIGPMSGIANARYLLEESGIEATEENAVRLLRLAKQRDKSLGPSEVRDLFARPDES